MLMNIWVKRNDDGKIHQVGTDSHDSLEMINEKVEYVNLQTNEGTLFGGYSFVEAPMSEDYVEITPDQLKMNKELIHKDLKKMLGFPEDAIIFG